VYVGIAKLSLVVAQSTSLKEVGSLDDRQRAELGCAVASGDRHKALELLDQVIRVAQAASDGQIIAIAKDAWTFDVETTPVAAVDRERMGSGDKAGADDWVPDAWREEE
jgi:hypothetical protein